MSDDNSGDGFALIVVCALFAFLILASLRVFELERRIQQLQAATQPVEAER